MNIALGIRSWFSHGEGFLSPADAVAAAKRAGADVVAFADCHEIGGLFEFLGACRNAGVIPVPGIELDLELEKEGRKPLLVFAGDNAVLGSFLEVVAAARREDDEHLVLGPQIPSLKGLSVVTGDHRGHLFHFAQQGDFARARMFLERLQAAGARVLMSVDPHFIKEQPPVAAFFEQLSADYPVVGFRPGVIGEEGDLVQMLAVRQIFGLADDPTLNRTPPVIRTLNRHAIPFPKALGSEGLLAIMPGLRAGHLLERETPPALAYHGLTPAAAQAQLQAECEAVLGRLVTRAALKADSETVYRNRLAQELELIGSRALAGYLLHLRDILAECRKTGIPTGIGRGSSVNSLVCYLLRITNVNPVVHRIPHERFLSTERLSLPDVDVDVSAEHLEKVHALALQRLPNAARLRVCNRYGFGQALTEGLRAAGVKDGARIVADLRHEFGGHFPDSLAEARAQHPEVMKRLETARLLPALQMVRLLMDRPRGFTLHVAGIAACDEELTRRVPVISCRTPAGETVRAVAVPYDAVENRGIIKFDLLPSHELDLLRRLRQRIGQVEGMSLSANCFDQKAVAETLGRGYNAGLFQLGELRHQRLLLESPIGTIEDLAQVSALIRLRSDERQRLMDAFLKGGGAEGFDSPSLKPILAETRGVPVYQEQIMQCLSAASGLSLATAEKIRHALAHQDEDEIRAGRAAFVASASDHRKLAPAAAEKLFDLIANQGGYTFPKGHAIAYSIYSAASCYFKYHYTGEFLCAQLDHLRRRKISGEERQSLVGRLAFEAQMLGASLEGLRFDQAGRQSYSVSEVEVGSRRVRLGLDVLGGWNPDTLQRIDARAVERKGLMTPADLTAAGVGTVDLGRLIAIGAFEHHGEPLPLMREHATGEVGRWQSTLERKQGVALAQLETIGFISDDRHPGFNLPTGARLSFRLNERRKMEETAVVGLVVRDQTRVRRVTRRNGDGFCADYELHCGMGDAPVRISRFFDKQADAESFSSRLAGIGPLEPVLVNVKGREVEGRVYWNSFSDLTVVGDVGAAVSIPDIVEARAKLKQTEADKAPETAH